MKPFQITSEKPFFGRLTLSDNHKFIVVNSIQGLENDPYPNEITISVSVGHHKSRPELYKWLGEIVGCHPDKKSSGWIVEKHK